MPRTQSAKQKIEEGEKKKKSPAVQVCKSSREHSMLLPTPAAAQPPITALQAPPLLSARALSLFTNQHRR
jgi:hypothetical protein